MLRTIERTSQLLKRFTLDTPEWGITDLAAELGWSTSTTHDLASSLAEIGLLNKSDRRRYTVGWRVLEMSHVLLGSGLLQTEARLCMERFATRYDETIMFGVIAGGKLFFAEKIISKQPLPSRFATPDGRFFAHCTAAGKVIMAYQSAAEQQEIIDEHGLISMTPKSIQTVEDLNAELARIRNQGHAYAFEEAVIGLGCVAAPVIDHSGQVVAALSIAAEIQQFERHLDRYRDVIIETARQLSRRLGHIFYTS